MGAKQSKRSVDISGKEAEGAGEVAGAGGEGRLEPLADADTLKPQLNGDAHHIHAPDQHTDKEKQLDNGTPENEKDATTEKENKEKETENEPEKTSAPLTNGDSEAAPDAPAAGQEVAKKPKKEKIKKKWSLRSISFSKKDKPKQDKKQKDEEPKTNGEPEKVPEETPENAVEAESVKAIEETKKILENGEEKTPETPVTEPLTNGSSTPESPKTETPQNEGSAVLTPDSDAQKEAPKMEPVPEPLPVNGVSPKDSKDDVTITEAAKTEDIKSEATPAVAPEAPASENSVQKEVCVEKMPLIEPTPPPLPASPPPSCVASFAETTMASHIEQTPLAVSLNPADLAPALTAHVANEPISVDKLPNISPIDSVSKNLAEQSLAVSIANAIDPIAVTKDEKDNQPKPDYVENLSSIEVNEVNNIPIPELNDQIETNLTCCPVLSVNSDNERSDVNLNDVTEKKPNEDCFANTEVAIDKSVDGVDHNAEKDKVSANGRTEPTISSREVISEIENLNCIISPDGIELENVINKKRSEETAGSRDKDLTEEGHTIECNGNIEETKRCTALPVDSDVTESVNMATTPDDSVAASITELPPPEEEAAERRDERQDSNEGSESFPAPPSDLDSVSSATSPEPQEPLPVSEKMTELSEKVTPEVIAEITAAVEPVTLQETSTDVAVAN